MIDNTFWPSHSGCVNKKLDATATLLGTAGNFVIRLEQIFMIPFPLQFDTRRCPGGESGPA